MIIQLSEKEFNRMKVLESLIRKEISREEAAVRMKISSRHVSRLVKKYAIGGVNSLVHKNRGKPSSRKMAEDKRKEIVRLIETHYNDFGPTLASEMLKERHNIAIHKEVLRRIMIEAGLWNKKRKRTKHRSWRPPKKHFGEMTQSDSSFHDWFEGRAPWCYLIRYVDDSSKTLLHAEFATSESYHSIATSTIAYFQKWGMPQQLYTDKGKVYRVNQNNENNEFITQYQEALQIVKVELIHAHSPQAKGRVERSFQTDQDRLVKYLRLANISDIEAANKYLQEVYIPLFNSKFSRPPQCQGDMHTPLGDINLFDIFCLREQRKVHNDWTIRYKNRLLQIADSMPAIVKPRDIVTVSERLDGSLRLTIRTSEIEFKEISQKLLKVEDPKYVWKPFKPAKNHPWRQSGRAFGNEMGHFNCATKEDIFTVP